MNTFGVAARRIPPSRSSSVLAENAGFLLGLAVAPLTLLFLEFANERLALLFVVIATTVMGTRIFLVHGGRQFTATGSYFLAIGCFGGLGGCLILYYGRYAIDTSLIAASLAVYLTSIIMYQSFLRRSSAFSASPPTRDSGVPGSRRSPLLMLGPSVVFIALGLSWLDPPLGPLPRELAYCGVLLTAGALIIPTRTKAIFRRPTYTLLTFLALAGYTARFFSGYGRLNLATLALAITALYVIRQPNSRAKHAVILAIIPFLILGGIIGATRRAYQAGSQENATYQLDARADVISQGEGLESVMSPLARSAELMKRDRETGWLATQIGEARGSTFLVALIPWIPRSWWPDKPFGFGRELAILLTPYDDGYSEAALIHGEWYYNFGSLGLLLMIPVQGLLLSRLDASMIRASARRPPTVPSLILLLIPLVLSTGLLDFVWMGAFTYTSRAGIRCLLLVVLYLVATRLLGAPGGRWSIHARDSNLALR